MKKFVSILLTAVLIMGTLCIGNLAADGDTVKEIAETASTEDSFVTAEPDEGEVSFSAAYAEAGKEIKAAIAGHDGETLLYKWYLDNVQINDFTDSYTPTEGDYEKLLTVKIYNTDCELIGLKSMLISPLPVVYIEVDDRQPVVDKEKQLDAYMKIQGNSEFNDESILYDGATQIKGRGNTTWEADKKPYKLKLGSKADLFGMGKSKHWVLLSNPFDSSNMRNMISYNFAGDIGLNYQSSVWVELVLNGRVSGVYQLCEHVRVDSNRVDITNWDDIAEDAAKAIYKKNTDIMTKDERDELVDIMTENMNWVTKDTITYKGNTFTVSDYYEVPSINGGYLLEVDWHEITLNFRTPTNVNVAVNKPEGIGTDMFNYIRDYYNAFETALFSDDFCTEYEGKKMRYTDFIDVESFAKGLILNEIFENFDFGLNSTYVSKEIDGKLVFGPIWDMDYNTVSNFTSWTTAKKAWLKRLLSDPVFLQEVRKVYFEYRYTDILDLVREGGDIDKAIEKINVPSVHNDKIWNSQIGFEENAKDLKLRLQTKLNWLDKQLETLDSAVNSINANKTVAAINSSDISLSIDSDILTVGFASVPASAEVFANGVLYKKLDAPSANETVELAPADSDITYTVVAYDTNGKVICGNYITTERYIKALTVTANPAKMKYNAGETLDLTGLELTAEYSNGTTAAVKPDAVYTYAKDSLGTQFYCYDKVTEQIGAVYAVFMYGNAKTELQLEIAPRENSDEVEQMILAIPEKCSDPYFAESFFKARVAYDALSSEAKAKVKNADALAEGLTKINEYVEEENQYVFGCCVDGVMRLDATNNLMVFVKNTARCVIFTLSEGGTSTYLRAGSNILSIKNVDDYYGYEIWTINAQLPQRIEYYDIRTAYNGLGIPTIINRRYTSEELLKNDKPVKSVDLSDYAWLNEEITLNTVCNPSVSEIKLAENGKDIEAKAQIEAGSPSLTFSFDTLGMHTLTLSYKNNDSWIECGTYSIYVREPVAETGELLAVDYSKTDYNETTQVKVVTDTAVETVALVSDSGETVELECVEKNGYKLWTGDAVTGEDYTLSVDGEETGEKISTNRLGDVNLDGKINSYDALLVLQFSTEQKTPDEGQAIRADMNGDGAFSSYDALLILKIATGKTIEE